MAQIRPEAVLSSSSMYNTTNIHRRIYTLWMRSLVYKNGCTVFDSNGDIVYRVDNFDNKYTSEVYLMDLRGTVLYILRRKGISIAFGRWDGYKCSEENIDITKERPCFSVVRKYCTCIDGGFACQVNAGSKRYQILRLAHNTGYRIVDEEGDIVAEVKKKETSSGVVLGDDVFTLAVEPQVDHSFIMALVTAYGLINHKL